MQTLKVELNPEDILAANRTDFGKTIWLWGKYNKETYGIRLDGDTLVRLDISDGKIIYMHFCLVESWECIVDDIKEMEFVNGGMLIELTQSD